MCPTEAGLADPSPRGDEVIARPTPRDTDALALRDAIRARRVRPSELLESMIARADRLDGAVHAIVARDLVRARKDALVADERAARGESLPLLGVPMTVKDNFDVAGLSTTMGLPNLRKNFASTDAALVRRLREAGAIVWAKTSVPMASYDWQCTSPVTKRCNNPHSLAHGPGGSSGGPAASLAAGFTSLELGSDVAGSIRVPAHVCGVVALRPSEGALSMVGHGRIPGAPPTLRSLAVVGPMARSVADLRLLFSVLVGADPLELRVPAALAPSLGKKAPQAITLGYADGMGALVASEDIVRVIGETIATLRAAGVRCEEKRIESAIDLDAAFYTWGVIQGFETSVAVPWIARARPLSWLLGRAFYYGQFGRSVFARGLSAGFGASSRTYFEALARRDQLVAQFDAFLDGLDGWLAPVWPIAALPHQKTGSAVQIDDRRVPYADALGAYTCPTATFGAPALALPIGRSREGLPIGAQIFARRWHDASLLELGQTLESILGRPFDIVEPGAPLSDGR